MKALTAAILLCSSLPVMAAQYSTQPAATPSQQHTLSITEHPGLCAADDRQCLSSRAPVYDWPVSEGDRIVITAESAQAQSDVVVRTRHLYLPVALGNPTASSPISITVSSLAPATSLRIEQDGTRLHIEPIEGVWHQVPVHAAAGSLYVRVTSPAPPQN
ncbi:MAG: hypothetical protein HC809_10175 [Gammaproteobacteria bacterium]|nr:hypothetical protein [Gammaproteobacteria bacterium]